VRRWSCPGNDVVWTKWVYSHPAGIWGAGPIERRGLRFAPRFKIYFAGSRPNAALTYTPSGTKIPVSIVLTIGQPRWHAQRHTWTFPATRIRKQPDNLPGTTVHIKPPSIPNPRRFASATLLIDDDGGSGGDGVFASNTTVEMGNGSSQAMGSVYNGDVVMSTDSSGNQVPETVSQSTGVPPGTGFSTEYIVLADGQQLIASADAVLADEAGGWVTAESIQAGMKLQTISGPQTVDFATLSEYYGAVPRLVVQGPTGTFFADGVLVGGGL
jgi:hypothetical protein